MADSDLLQPAATILAALIAKDDSIDVKTDFIAVFRQLQEAKKELRTPGEARIAPLSM